MRDSRLSESFDSHLFLRVGERTVMRDAVTNLLVAIGPAGGRDGEACFLGISTVSLSGTTHRLLVGPFAGVAEAQVVAMETFTMRFRRLPDMSAPVGLDDLVWFSTAGMAEMPRGIDQDTWSLLVLEGLRAADGDRSMVEAIRKLYRILRPASEGDGLDGKGLSVKAAPAPAKAGDLVATVVAVQIPQSFGGASPKGAFMMKARERPSAGR